MSQIEDFDAIKKYVLNKSTTTPQAFDKQIQFKLWTDELSWYQTHADANVLAKASRYKQDFDAANTRKKGASAQKLNDGTTQTADLKPKERLTIKLGSTGDNVKDWQTFLKIAPVDGRFGPDTRLKTITWQKNNGLFADGVVGPITWQKALGLNAIQVVASAAKKAVAAILPPVTAPTASEVATAKPFSDVSRIASKNASTAVLRQGSKGQDVVNWQTILGIKPDGNFGPDTTKLTKEWQKSNGLTADGVVGPASWAAAIVLENQPKKKPSTSTATSAVTTKAIATVKALPKVTVSAVKGLPLWQKIVGGAAALGLGFATFRTIKR